MGFGHDSLDLDVVDAVTNVEIEQGGGSEEITHRKDRLVGFGVEDFLQNEQIDLHVGLRKEGKAPRQRHQAWLWL